jgi:hypothetical protein
MIYKCNGEISDQTVGFDASFENIGESVGIDLTAEGYNGAYAVVSRDDFIRAALAIMGNDKPGKFAKTIKAVTGILKHYHLTVNGGEIADDTAYKAAAVDLINLLEGAQNETK